MVVCACGTFVKKQVFISHRHRYRRHSLASNEIEVVASATTATVTASTTAAALAVAAAATCDSLRGYVWNKLRSSSSAAAENCLKKF